MEVSAPSLQPLYGFLNFVSEDANLSSIARLFRILAPLKEKAFCPCAVFFLAGTAEHNKSGGAGIKKNKCI